MHTTSHHLMNIPMDSVELLTTGEKMTKRMNEEFETKVAVVHEFDNGRGVQAYHGENV